MCVIKVTCGDLYSVAKEINGINNAEIGLLESGLIHEELDFKTKYYLGKIGKFAEKEFNEIEKIRHEYINKHGVENKNGNKEISVFIIEGDKKNPNPEFEKFKNEINKVFEIEKDLNMYSLTLDSFSDIKSKNTYSIFMSFLELVEEQKEAV